MNNKVENLDSVSQSNYKDFIRLDFKNGIYQGQHIGYHNEGLGCFCSDDGLFYFGVFYSFILKSIIFRKVNG